MGAPPQFLREMRYGSCYLQTKRGTSMGPLGELGMCLWPSVRYCWRYLTHPWKKSISESLAEGAYGSWIERCTWTLASIPMTTREKYKLPMVHICKSEWKRWSRTFVILRDCQGKNVNPVIKTLHAIEPQRNVLRGSQSAKTCKGQLRVYSWTCTKSTKASKKKISWS